MRELRIIYKKDLLDNEYPYGIRDRSGYLLFFRKVTRFPNQDIRYENELIDAAEQPFQADSISPCASCEGADQCGGGAVECGF